MNREQHRDMIYALQSTLAQFFKDSEYVTPLQTLQLSATIEVDNLGKITATVTGMESKTRQRRPALELISPSGSDLPRSNS